MKGATMATKKTDNNGEIEMFKNGRRGVFPAEMADQARSYGWGAKDDEPTEAAEDGDA